jgi:hypothetical protein
MLAAILGAPIMVALTTVGFLGLRVLTASPRR